MKKEQRGRRRIDGLDPPARRPDSRSGGLPEELQAHVMEDGGGAEDPELGLQRPGRARIGRTWAGHGRRWSWALPC